MKRNSFILIVVTALLLTACTSKKQQLVDQLTEGINEHNTELLQQVYPDLKQLDLQLDGCQIAIQADSVTENEDRSLTLPAQVTTQDGRTVALILTAKLVGEDYQVCEAEGYLPLTRYGEWAPMARSCGAVSPRAGEAAVAEFLSQDRNRAGLQQVLDTLMPQVLTVQLVQTCSRTPSEEAELMGFWGKDLYNVVVTNHTGYTFPRASVMVMYKGADGPAHKEIGFSSLKPGDNTVSFEIKDGLGGDANKAFLSPLEGVSDADRAKAVKQYKFTGEEWHTYITQD